MNASITVAVALAVLAGRRRDRPDRARGLRARSPRPSWSSGPSGARSHGGRPPGALHGDGLRRPHLAGRPGDDRRHVVHAHRRDLRRVPRRRDGAGAAWSPPSRPPTSRSSSSSGCRPGALVAVDGRLRSPCGSAIRCSWSGAPYGLGHSLSVGQISARWPANTVYAAMALAEFFQTDAVINTGNSGGPMFDMKGDVIGIVSHNISKSGGSEGLGFVVTLNTARQLLLERTSFWSGTRGDLSHPSARRPAQRPQPADGLDRQVRGAGLARGGHGTAGGHHARHHRGTGGAARRRHPPARAGHRLLTRQRPPDSARR